MCDRPARLAFQVLLNAAIEVKHSDSEGTGWPWAYAVIEALEDGRNGDAARIYVEAMAAGQAPSLL